VNGEVEKRADVMVAGTMALARAMVIMAEGDRAAVNNLLETAIAALKSAVDEGLELMAVMSELEVPLAFREAFSAERGTQGSA